VLCVLRFEFLKNLKSRSSRRNAAEDAEQIWLVKRLVLRLVFAGFAALLAVEEAVFAETHVMLSHAEKAKAVAPAALFRHFAGGTTELHLGESHAKTLARRLAVREVTGVT
jgi:hypothetical protein